MAFTSTGTLKYDPPHGQTWGKNSSSAWWVILECDPGIVGFYRWLWEKRYWKKLVKPAWGSHISVVRGEEPPHRSLWDRLEGKTFEFSYSPEIHDNGEYVWLDAEVPELFKVREELGLPRHPEFSWHITLGMHQY